MHITCRYLSIYDSQCIYINTLLSLSLTQTVDEVLETFKDLSKNFTPDPDVSLTVDGSDVASAAEEGGGKKSGGGGKPKKEDAKK